MPRVQILTEAQIHPYAECLGSGDNPDVTNCGRIWAPSPYTRADVKTHIKSHPTHKVLVTREVRTVYGINY